MKDNKGSYSISDRKRGDGLAESAEERNSAI